MTSRYRRPLARAGALATLLACGAPLAQPSLKDTPAKWQLPPTLTLPAAALAPPAPRIPEPAIEKATWDATVLFDFESSALHPEGRAALEDFVARLGGATVGMIRVVGHADRLGSEARNQILSEDRAEAVKAYLVAIGIEPGRVRIEGRGAAQPATRPGECAGARSARVVACLQPDRRVGVEVAGTRPSADSGQPPAGGR